MERLSTLGLNRTQQALLLLLRAGLWEIVPNTSEPFPLSDKEWAEVAKLAGHQTIQGIVFRGMQLLPPELLPPKQQLWNWSMTITRLEADYKRTTAAVSATQNLLSKIGMTVWLQKGLAVARYYSQPSRRVNGDIDWYVSATGSETNIKDLLQKKGYTIHRSADDSLCFEYDGIIVELHKYLTDLLSTRGREAEETLIHSETLESLELPDGTKAIVPGPCTTILMLVTHILKHISTVGIGLRQCCDLARACHVLYHHYDVSMLLTACHHAHLDRWCRLIGLYLTEILTLPAEECPWRIDSPNQRELHNMHNLLNDILRSGNFGHQNINHPSLINTALNTMRRLPFSLQYAPAETIQRTITLFSNRIIKNNT